MIEYILDIPIEVQTAWLLPAITAGASLLGGLFGMKSTSDANKANADLTREMWDKQVDYQNFLLHNQKQMQMQDAKQAGINPAFAQGSIIGGGTASAPSASAPTMQPMDMSFIGQSANNAVNGLIQQKNLDILNSNAQIQDEKAKQERMNTELQGLQLDDEKGKRSMYQSVSAYDEKGNLLQFDNYADYEEFAKDYERKHHGKSPDVYISRYSGEMGRTEAKKELRELKSRFNELNASDAQNLLAQKVATAQGKDKEVLEALVKMPAKDFALLMQNLQTAVNDNNLFKMKKDSGLFQLQIDQEKWRMQMEKESNVKGLIDKWSEGKFDWKDIPMFIVSALLPMIQGGSTISNSIHQWRTPAPVHNTYNTTNVRTSGNGQ